MPDLADLLIVVSVAFAAPFLVGFFPSLLVPAVVFEIVAGIVIGPSVLGIVEIDDTLTVVSLIGLAFLLFLAGLEIEIDKLRGQVLRIAGAGFALSLAIAVVVSLSLSAAGLVETPLLVAIILCATSLGVLIPVLKDTGEIATPFGQLVIAASSIADFGAIILLSVFFSGEGGVGATLVLIGMLARARRSSMVVVVRGAERSRLIRADLLRLQDTTAQIRVRGAIVLMIAFAAVAEELGLEVILGRLHRRRGPVARRPRRGHVAHPTSAQARRDGLRVLRPGLLRDQRRALRPRRAPGQAVDPRDGPDLPRGAGRGTRRARAPLPAAHRRRPRAASPACSRPRRFPSSSPPRRSAPTWG